MPAVYDILTRMKSIHAAIACSFVAAIISYAGGTYHGSHANSSMLAAMHWMLVVLLSLTYLVPDILARTDVEAVWLTFGFLFGEQDLESVAACVLILVSAFFFHLHRRGLLRQEAAVDAVEPPLPDSTEAAF